MNFKSKKSGLVRTILIILIAILLLSYFGIDIRGVVESDQSQSNFGYVGGIISNVWNNYLKAPATFIWEEFFVKILWGTFVGAMDKIKSGEKYDLQNQGPGLSEIPVN